MRGLKDYTNNPGYRITILEGEKSELEKDLAHLQQAIATVANSGMEALRRRDAEIERLKRELRELRHAGGR